MALPEQHPDLSVRQIINTKKNKTRQKFTEKLIPALLLLTAIVSVLTTIGILFTLL